MHENGFGYQWIIKKYSFMTHNNQQSFHVLTIFEHRTTYNTRNNVGSFL